MLWRRYFPSISRRISRTLASDPSYPNFQHGYNFNDIGRNEETFRVPLIIRSPVALGSARVLLRPGGSHVDLSPTLMELLGIDTEHHCFGSSLLPSTLGTSFPRGSPTPSAPLRRPSFIAQPYDGTHWCAVRWPHKLCRNLRRGTFDPLRDVELDPLEERDATLFSPGANASLALLRLDLALLPPLTQRLIEEDRVYPVHRRDAPAHP